jgi:hypothetical protein
MPLFNNIPNWNGFEIEVRPAETWRQKVRFWPYFVGQIIQLELVFKKTSGVGVDNLQFHIVEKMPDLDKPKIIAPRAIQDRLTPQEAVFSIQDSSKITGKGEIRYWVSNRGYNVDNEPVFTTEAICLDTLVIPTILVIIGPMIGFLSGLVLGLIIGG